METILIQVREKGDRRDWEDIPEHRYETDFPDRCARARGREYESIGKDVVQVCWRLYAAPGEGQMNGHYIDFPEEPEYQIAAWIPVTEQLPPDGQECWTYQPVNDTWHRFEEIVSAHQFYENYGNDWGGWWIGVEKDAGNFSLWSALSNDPADDQTLLITHWMPYEVPEPPGEGEA